ncbi:hypothetical protein NFI96_002106 [Prochilodus magdalenae]|nr:hypothetical protein NFI96_002106 [Prochilodus magdalenae]
MAQSGKILHLYVEFQRGALNSPHGLGPSAGVLHKGGSSTQSLASNKSPSRHSSEPIYERDSRFSGHFTAPPTPSGIRRAYGREDEGKRSFVTYSYIEKANIKSVEGHQSPSCQSEPENPFKKTMNDQAVPLHLRKRLSDPVKVNGWESTSSSNPKHALSGSVSTPRGNPNLRRATLDTIAREATLRALEEFGSPQLKRRLAANSPEGGHDVMHREQTRCRSWSGSPIVPRSARTLPTNAQIINSEQHRTLHGIPRSPATDHLSVHAGQPYYTKSPTTMVRSQESQNQRLLKGEESLKQGYRHGSPLPSCRPTAIHHEIPSMTITQAPCEQRHSTSESPRQPHKVNFNLSSSSNLSEAGSSKAGGRKSTSPATSPEMARRLAEEATKLSILMEARRSPSPTPSFSDTVRGSTSPALPSMLHRLDLVSTSPIRDPQQERMELPRKDSPVLYWHRLPQYTGDNRTLEFEDRRFDARYDSGLGDSPESNRRHCMTNNSVDWMSQQQRWRNDHSSRVKEDSSKRNLSDSGSPLGTCLKEFSKQTRNGSAVLGSQENHYRVPAQKEIRGNAEKSSASPKGSSGVTDSLEQGTLDRDCISPEASSQMSSDTRNMGIQD